MVIEKIPVVFGIDKNYVLQVFVVIRSVLMHSKNDFCFYIITTDELEDDINTLDKILQSEYTNYELKILRPDIDKMKGANIKNQHISLASYNRLFIPELLPEIDKCIYMDSDVLVLGDVSDLFQTDVSNYYVAGVKDFHIISNNSEKHRNILGRDDISNYINAGVLVLNLKKIRADKIETKWIEGISVPNMYEDQDIINRSCYEKILCINPRFNMFHYYINESNNEECILYLEKQGIQMRNDDLCIVHMGGSFKPWESGRFKFTSEWWAVAKAFSGTAIYQDLKKHMACSHKYIYSARQMVDVCKDKQAVIWGAGYNGKIIHDCLVRNKHSNIVFVDRNKEKIGSNYRQTPILSPDDKAIDDDCIWLVSIKSGFGDVFKYLEGKGVSMDRVCGVMNCVSKERMYYQALSIKYYDDEKEDIAIALGLSENGVYQLLDNEILLKSIGGLSADEWYGLT